MCRWLCACVCVCHDYGESLPRRCGSWKGWSVGGVVVGKGTVEGP